MRILSISVVSNNRRYINYSIFGTTGMQHTLIYKKGIVGITTKTCVAWCKCIASAKASLSILIYSGNKTGQEFPRNYFIGPPWKETYSIKRHNKK